MYLLVRVDNGIEGQAVSPAGCKILQFNHVLVSASKYKMLSILVSRRTSLKLQKSGGGVERGGEGKAWVRALTNGLVSWQFWR